MYLPLVLRHLPVVDGGDWGLDEKDMEASVATVRSMCEQVDADLITLRERNEAAGLVRDYLIRRRVGELDFLEVRCVVGDGRHDERFAFLVYLW